VPPPVARRVPRVDEIHSDRRIDEYAWLRDKDDPEVTAYLEAENAYADAVMEPTAPIQAALYAEMLARIKETDARVPYRKGQHLYYSRTEHGKQYPIYCRKRGSLEADEEVTLDLNALAEGKPFMALGAYQASGDGRLLAYSTDDTGFRQYTLFAKDLTTGEVVERVAEKVGSVAWAADDRTLFYTVEEESTKRQYRVYRHRLGTDAHDLVYEEPDLAFNLGVSRSRSGAFLVLGAGSLTTSDARVLPAHQPDGRWRLVAPRLAEQEYDVEHHGAFFYIRANDRGRSFRLVKAPVSAPGREGWEEVVPHRADVMLEAVDAFPRPPRSLRARGRPAAVPRDRPPGRSLAPHRVPGAGLLRLPRGQPRVRHVGLPLRLPVARDPGLGVRLRPREAHGHAAQADGGARRLPA
jgi:oligopeptidase B